MTELSPAAKQVRREYMRLAKDPAWRMAFEIALGEWMREITAYHQGPLQAIADRAVMRSLAEKRDDLAKSYLLSKITEIRKKDEWTAEDEAKVRRVKGRFAPKGGASGPYGVGEQMGANLRRGGPSAPGYYKPAPQPRRERSALVIDQERQEMLRTGKIPYIPEEARLGRTVEMTAKPVTLNPYSNPTDHQAEVLRRQAAMTYALESKTRSSEDKQRVQYTVTGPNGPRVVTPSAGEMPPIDYDGGERVQYMAPVGPDTPTTVAGKVMDLGLVAGMEAENAAKAGSVVADVRESLNSTTWGRKFTHLANVARVMSNDSSIANQAVAVAGLVNILGEDAARAFGPKMRQLSYRYTGQEAKAMQMSDAARTINAEDVEKDEEVAAREQRIIGYENRLITDLARNSLPTKTEYGAALQVGTTPPSKGYILDKNGKVVTEAVGFSDDWYTPFNLKRLPKLKDGSYVRSRGYGGLTTEDIQLALHTGAARAIVVSNSGVFAIEFDERGRSFGNRYGPAGAAMQRRYAKSLDALKYQNINNTAETGGKLKLDQAGYEVALKDLKQKFPYLVKNVYVLKKPIQGSTGTYEAGEEDQGYVRPLSIKATGARYGYSDPSVQGTRQAYDSLTAYQLRRGQFEDIRRASAEREAAKEKANNPTPDRPRDQNLSPVEQRMAQLAEQRREREKRGEGTSTSAYKPEEPLDNMVVGPELVTLRGIVQQDVPNSEVDDEEINNWMNVLRSGVKQPDPDYLKARAQYAGSRAFRDRVHDAIGEVYAKTPRIGELSNIVNAHRTDVPSDVKADAEAKIAAGESDDVFETAGDDRDYEPSDQIPRAAIMENPLIQQWLAQMGVDAENNPRLAGQREMFDSYINIQEGDLRAGNREGYNRLDPEERMAYDTMHSRVIQRLNAFRAGGEDLYADFQRDEDREPERVPPPSRPTPKDQEPGPQGVSRYRVQSLQDILTSRDMDELVATAEGQLEDIFLNEELEPSATLNVVQDHIDWMERQEAELHRRGEMEMARKLASAIETMRDKALDWEVEDEEPEDR